MRLFINFDRDPDLPLHKQLFEALKEAIGSGRLATGEKLPSTRELAKDLMLARNTVAKSYEQLIAEGFIETVHGAGTFVSEKQVASRELVEDVQASDYKLSKFADRMAEPQHGVNALISYRLPRRQDLPTKKWHQLILKHSRLENSTGPAWSSDVLGLLPLRQALSQYLKQSRVVSCDAEHIVIYPNRRDALDFLSKVLFEAGDTIGMERPGHPLLRSLFKANGLQVEQIPTNVHGLNVDGLINSTKLRAVYVTPSHQVLTGAVLPAQRRRKLVEWARSAKAVIIEDDFDWELVLYEKHLEQAMQGIDRGGSVIYVGSFANSLAPLTEVAYAVVPDRLLMTIRNARAIFAGCAASLEEKVLSEFLASGAYARYLKSLREKYTRRRALLKHELGLCSPSVTICRDGGVANLLVDIDTSVSSETVEICGSKAGLPLVSTSQFYGGASGSSQKQFLVSYCRVPEADIEEAVALFRAYLKECEAAEGGISAVKNRTGRMSLG
jgi:GntR family transcriptional regulator/MocR family aminotransferase